MPKIKSVAVTYGEKVSRSYQSVDYTLTVNIDVEEGENLDAIIHDTREKLASHVASFTQDEVARLVSLAQNGGRS